MAGSRKQRAVLLRLVRRLGVASDRLGQTFAGQHGLHHTDLEALLHVMESEGRGEAMTAGQLAGALGLTSGATTGVIDRLSRAGHLDRHRDSLDRRKVQLRYGEPARAVAQDFFGPLEGLSARALEDFSADELEAAGRVLAALTDAIADYARSVGPDAPGTRT